MGFKILVSWKYNHYIKFLVVAKFVYNNIKILKLNINL